MKIISLIPLTRGTGITQYIASFAMIEKDKLMILNLDKYTTLGDVLHVDKVNQFVHIFTNQSNTKMSLEAQTALYFTRFNNIFISLSHFDIETDTLQIDPIVEQIRRCLPNYKAKYLLVNYPYKLNTIEVNQVVQKSTCTLLFSDFSCEVQSAISSILENNHISRNLLGLVIAASENMSFTFSQLQDKLKFEPIEVFGVVPYNLLFARATINKKVVLEFDDTISAALEKLWVKIKSKTVYLVN